MARRSLISQELPSSARARPPRRSRKRRWFLAFALLLIAASAALIFTAPSIARWYVRNKVVPKASRLLKRTIEIRDIEIGWGHARFGKIAVRSDRDGDKPMFAAARIEIRFLVRPLFSGKLVAEVVDIVDAEISLLRHADGRDNLRDLLRRRKNKAPTRSGRLTIGRVDLHGAKLSVVDRVRNGELVAARMEGMFVPGAESRVIFHQVELKAKALPSKVDWQRIEVEGRLSRSLRGPLPRIRLKGGRFRILPQLEVSGVRGTISPKEEGQRFGVDIEGSYAGADTALWSAKGWVEPFAMKGEILAKATRFELARIAEYFRQTPVIYPERTAIDGHLNLKLDDKQLHFDGQLSVARLNIFHPGLARVAIEDLSGGVFLKGRIESNADLAVELEQLRVNYRGVQATLAGRVDGLLSKPTIEMRLKVPKVPCQKVLDALPKGLVPRLQGFRLKGNFSADLKTHIDYSKLAKLKLGGKMPVDRCKVTYAPPRVSAERLLAPFEHEVEHRPGDSLSFVVGPEEEDFALYSEIPSHVVNAFLTTEDGAFFRHKGFIVSQFRAALSRNLGKGGFRLGASTISMQMVKNVLLTHEKTLARKLQELFLVWYLERVLTKERIMEIYLNAIEFGPGIYGIGRAAKYYFHKEVSEITPLEAAFFAVMLPSPKRRYVQYCDGKMKPKWRRKMHRVLRRMVRRNRLTQEEYDPFIDKEIAFDRDFEADSARDCGRRLEALLESWDDEHFRRLRLLIERYAPHQAERYLRRQRVDASKKKVRRKRK
jgi:hypothetical protein